jgi:hypothetical protein
MRACSTAGSSNTRALLAIGCYLFACSPVQDPFISINIGLGLGFFTNLKIHPPHLYGESTLENVKFGVT